MFPEISTFACEYSFNKTNRGKETHVSEVVILKDADKSEGFCSLHRVILNSLEILPAQHKVRI
jgi:hypothetical protein